jgi:hypothetical protein
MGTCGMKSFLSWFRSLSLIRDLWIWRMISGAEPMRDCWMAIGGSRTSFAQGRIDRARIKAVLQVFHPETGALTWRGTDEGERSGRSSCLPGPLRRIASAGASRSQGACRDGSARVPPSEPPLCSGSLSGPEFKRENAHKLGVRSGDGSKPVYDLELFSLRHFEGAASLPR